MTGNYARLYPRLLPPAVFFILPGGKGWIFRSPCNLLPVESPGLMKVFIQLQDILNPRITLGETLDKVQSPSRRELFDGCILLMLQGGVLEAGDNPPDDALSVEGCQWQWMDAPIISPWDISPGEVSLMLVPGFFSRPGVVALSSDCSPADFILRWISGQRGSSLTERFAGDLVTPGAVLRWFLPAGFAETLQKGKEAVAGFLDDNPGLEPAVYFFDEKGNITNSSFVPPSPVGFHTRWGHPESLETGDLINQEMGLFSEVQIIEADGFYMATVSTGNPGIFHGGDAFSIGGGCNPCRETALGRAMGEALERYCASFYRQQALDGPSFRRVTIPLAPSQVKNPAYPPGGEYFSREQYHRCGFPYEPLKDDKKVCWAHGTFLDNVRDDLDYTRGLNREEHLSWPVSIPAGAVFLPYREEPGESVILPDSSCGLGCGATLEDALRSAILELMERHALAVAWLEGFSVPRLDSGDVLCRLSGKYAGLFSSSRRRWRFLDLSSYWGLPTLWGYCREDTTMGERFSCGSACHQDPMVCLEKTLDEIQQNRMALRDEEIRKAGEYLREDDPFKIRSYRDHLLFYNCFPHILDRPPFTGQDIHKGSFFRQEPGPATIFDLSNIICCKDASICYSILTTADVRWAGFHVVRAVSPELLHPAGAHGEMMLNLSHVATKKSLVLPHPFP